MSLVRYVGHLKRKFRVILVFFCAIVATATVAYYNGMQMGESGSVPVHNIRPGVKRLIVDPPSRLVPKEHSNNEKFPPLQEYDAEYDTIDIYKESIARVPLHSNRTAKARSKTPEKLKVFVLPFTHVDPGWLRTFDSYSEDTNKILDNMHKFMMKNEKMRFMWAEFVFFERWWTNQTDEVKHDVRGLVSSGRLELASGSWVMTDEANAIFPVSVDNIVEGQQFVHREFGIKSSVVWSNDPFGYSNSVPYLFKQAGLNRAVINRIHHGIKGHLQSKHAIPFRWRQYFDESGSSDVLTHVLPYTHYDVINSCGPHGGACCEFDFKRITHWNCPGPKPVPITPENVKQKAATLVNQLETMSKMYESPVLLMVHGDDFRFDMIEEWHQQHDNFMPVFDEINKGSKAEIRFGTFTDYFNEMEKWYADKKIQPATLSGDFFPYQCALGDIWTGYFTTRPFFKRQGRLLHSLIRAADLLSSSQQMSLSTSQRDSIHSSLTTARRTLSLFQHHDAITGTSKRHVMEDYSKLLFKASNLSRKAFETALDDATGTATVMAHFPSAAGETQTKLPLGISKGNTLYAHVYNSLPYTITDTVSIRVDSADVAVRVGGADVEAQIEPYVYLGEFAQKTYLLTVAVKMNPLSTVTLELVPTKNPPTTKIARVSAPAQFVEKLKAAIPSLFTLETIEEAAFGLKTDHLTTTHDIVGLLESVTTASTGRVPVTSSFVAYTGARGGAYLMRVAKAETYVPSSVPRLLVTGPIQQSAHLFLNNIYHRMTAKNIPGTLGQQVELHIRIDIQKEKNTEVAMRIQTGMADADTYADSVGLQLLKRERHASLDVASNYYPMPSAAVVDNGSKRLTVSSNVEHGMMTLKGGMEIMIDRILNQDDGKGLGSDADSIPTDMKPVDMQFSLLVENMVKQPSHTDHYTGHTGAGQISVQSVLYPPIIAVGTVPPKVSESQPLPPLPCDYQLLTVRSLSGSRRLLTLYRNGAANGGDSHAQSCGDDATASTVAYLRSIGAKWVQETNLSGIETKGEKISVDSLKVSLHPFKFLTLVVTTE